MKYRTKPFEIEAVQYTGDNIEEIHEVFETVQLRERTRVGVGQRLLRKEGETGPVSYSSTLEVFDYLQETWVRVSRGDYIIRGMRGEYYPTPADVFENNYEPDLPPTKQQIDDAIAVIQHHIDRLRTDLSERTTYSEGKTEVYQEEIDALEASRA